MNRFGRQQQQELKEAQQHLEALESNLTDYQKKREFDAGALQVRARREGHAVRLQGRVKVLMVVSVVG